MRLEKIRSLSFSSYGDVVMAVPVEVAPSFRVVGRPVELFRGSYRSMADPGSAVFNYDVTPDGSV
ncbi:MAG: hypothetical protein E2P02_13015 [Acidobacteria bacterium]|nr:MAG: hypothetical protein E2P02_13015 [Acidobacteriota bacterium]